MEPEFDEQELHAGDGANHGTTMQLSVEEADSRSGSSALWRAARSSALLEASLALGQVTADLAQVADLGLYAGELLCRQVRAVVAAQAAGAKAFEDLQSLHEE